MLSKWNCLVEDVTVEPCFFFYYIGYLILEVVNTNLYLQKTCRFNATIATSEPDLDTQCEDEKRGILFTSKMDSEYRFYMYIICYLYFIQWTCWSDKAGRRRLPLIYLPIIGLILQSLSGILHSYFWQWQPIAAALSEMGCEVIGGGIVMMATSTIIYICDVSTIENRTMRLGMVLAVRTLCELLALGSSGFLLRALGFFYSYLVCLVLAIISLVLALIFVRDISVPVEKKPRFLQFFNPTGIVDSFKVVFKKRLGNRRIVVLLVMITGVMVFFTTLGTIFCSVVLSKHFKIHDGVIGMFAGFWDTIAVLFYLFAFQNWQLYAIPLFEMFHGTAYSVSQSFFSKYYDSSEFGRLNAVQSVFGLAIPACLPAYNIIFQKTLDFFPSAFFILSASMDVIIVLLYGLSYYLCRKFDNQPEVNKAI